ncbi:MAG: ABC transporter ATP-binding protein [Pirellulales bacterium]|nr:ABC transporter ATP-binding protein [Pirellulales bacterium]
MPLLELDDVTFGYGSGTERYEVLRGANLAIRKNEFVAVIGFSGSGKSTLVSLLAGLLTPDAGEVRLHGRPQSSPGPDRGVVFQNYSLLPWLSAAGNIELAVRKVFPEMTRAARREYVQRYVDLVTLTGAESRKPHELSGGMRQRLALARTLAMQPEVLLLDEPLSALDALTRAVLQDEIIRLWEEDKRTVVMITNDVDEAVLMADRIVPLTPGPGAHFGREFAVTLPRPRDRATLNFNPQFKQLRNDVTKYMLSINAENRQWDADATYPLPDVQPVLPQRRQTVVA